MKNMTAIAITTPGGPEVLTPVTIPVPVPKPGEILVKVRAAGVNRPDVLQRQGGYPPPPGAPDTPGLEIAGEVVALGDGVKRFEAGDRICALVPGGGYAEFAVVHEDNALPVPPGLSFTEAAAIPETFFTVWTNVFDRGRLKEGETLLVHGGSSGIGTTAIMLGKAFGAVVAVTAGSEDKCQACRDLGAGLLDIGQRADRVPPSPFLDPIGEANAPRAAMRPIQRQAIANGAAEHLADGNAERFGFDVDERVFDGGDRLLVHAAGGLKGHDVQEGDILLDRARIQADQPFSQPTDDGAQAFGAEILHEFRPPDDACVGGNFQKRKIPPTSVTVQVLDLHNPHGASPVRVGGMVERQTNHR